MTKTNLEKQVDSLQDKLRNQEFETNKIIEELESIQIQIGNRVTNAELNNHE